MMGSLTTCSVPCKDSDQTVRNAQADLSSLGAHAILSDKLWPGSNDTYQSSDPLLSYPHRIFQVHQHSFRHTMKHTGKGKKKMLEKVKVRSPTS